MIKVCDAIMGSGKSSAAITYINEHPEKRFLYITPYLDEATRIKEGCPRANFVEPRSNIPEFGFSKSSHILELVKRNVNISSTHQAMFYYTSETVQMLKENGYCIIIDEAIRVLDSDTGLSSDDIQVTLEAGLIYQSAPCEYRRTDKPYAGDAHAHMLRLLKSRPLIQLDPKDKAVWCWLFSKELFEEVDDIYILTYLFKGSEMEQFLKINGLDYKYIGVSHPREGYYTFSDEPDYIPEYVKDLKNKIHILEKEKLNSIGDGKHDLSMNWYAKPKNADKIEQLQKNIYNYFRNIIKDVPSTKRMCGTFSEHWGKIRSKGYGNYKRNRVIFSQRSKNEWSDHTALAYPVNLFLNPKIANYYSQRGGKIDEDTYALSIMIQWIWRSAIRNGEEIYIYVPSKRMRTLLINWIEEISKGGN